MSKKQAVLKYRHTKIMVSVEVDTERLGTGVVISSGIAVLWALRGHSDILAQSAFWYAEEYCHLNVFLEKDGVYTSLKRMVVGLHGDE